MRIDELQRVGIMYDADMGDGRAYPFPFLREMPYPEAEYYVDQWCEDFGDWYTIARDPAPMMYGDADREAMDKTNYAALISCLGDPTEIPQLRDMFMSGYRRDSDGTDADCEDALEKGYASVGWLLVVRPDKVDELDELQRCQQSLSDYPLLDEEAYSALEWEAWDEYLHDGARWDVTRALALDEATEEALEDSWDDVAPAACGRLHYYSGWDVGAHYPPLEECVAGAIVEGIVRVYFACLV